MNEHYTLKQEDVGKPSIRAFGRAWMVCDFIGSVLPGDVGKRVYERGGILQVENNEQFAARSPQIKTIFITLVRTVNHPDFPDDPETAASLLRDMEALAAQQYVDVDVEGWTFSGSVVIAEGPPS